MLISLCMQLPSSATAQENSNLQGCDLLAREGIVLHPRCCCAALAGRCSTCGRGMAGCWAAWMWTGTPRRCRTGCRFSNAKPPPETLRCWRTRAPLSGLCTSLVTCWRILCRFPCALLCNNVLCGKCSAPLWPLRRLTWLLQAHLAVLHGQRPPAKVPLAEEWKCERCLFFHSCRGPRATLPSAPAVLAAS